MADGKKQDNAGGSVFRAPAPRPKSVAPAPPSAVRGRPLQPQQPTAGILASSIRGTSMTRASEIGSVSSVDASRRSSLHGLLPHERDRNKLVLAPRQGQSFKLPHESLKGPGPWIKLEGTRTAKSTPGVHHQEGANRSTTTSTRKGNDENAVPGTVTPPSKARPKVLKRHSDVALLQQPPRSQSSAKDAREFRKHVFYLHPASVNDQDKAEFTQQIERLGAVGPASQLQCMVFDQTWFTSRCQRVDVFLSKSTTHLIRSHVRADNIDAKALRLNPNVHIWGPNELKERLSRYLKPENAAVPVRKSLTQRFLEEKLHGPSTSRGAVDEKKYHYFKGRYLLCEEKSGAFKPILVKEYGKGQEDTDDPQKPYPTLYCDKVVLNRCPFNYHDYQEEDIKASIARDHERYRQAKLEDQTRLARKQGKRRKRMARAFREFGSLSMVYFANETEMQESEDALRRAIAKKTEQSVDVVNRLADQAMEAEADENGKPRHSNSNHRPSHSMASGQSKVTLVASIGGASVEASGFGKSQSTMSRILQGAEMPAYKHNGLVVDLSRPGSKNKKRKSAASEAPADPSERIMPAFMTKAGYCEHCCVKYDQFHEHVKSNLHLTYAKNASIFRELDSLLGDLTRERKAEESEEEDEDEGFDGDDCDGGSSSDSEGDDMQFGDEAGDGSDEEDDCDDADEDEDDGDSNNLDRMDALVDEEREDELLDGDEIAEDQIDDQPEEPIAEEAGAEEFPDLPPLPSGPREPERFIVEPALSVVQATEVAEPEDGVANVVPIPGSKLEGSADAIRLDYDPSVASCASKSGVAASVANERKRASEDDPQSSSAHRSKTLKTEMGRSGGASDLVLLRTPDFGVAEDGGSVFKEFPSFHSYTARSHSARSTPRRRFGVDEGTAEEDIEKGVVRVASEDARINQMQHSYTKHSSPRPLGSPLSLSARRTASPDHVGYTKPRSTPQKLHRFAKGSQAETGEDDDADANSFNAVSGTPGSKLRHEVRSDATIDEVA